MLLTKQPTPKTPSSETTLTEKKQPQKLSARWIKVDGKFVCRWSTP
jgi:hypothetical protein